VHAFAWRHCIASEKRWWTFIGGGLEHHPIAEPAWEPYRGGSYRQKEGWYHFFLIFNVSEKKNTKCSRFASIWS
jgi:hypothetical protein